jgi:hypothetical protein
MSESYESEIRRAVGFARERGWKFIRKTCFSTGPLVKGKPRVCVCPLMALVVMNAKDPEAALKRLISRHRSGQTVHPDDLARSAGKVLGVKPVVAMEFMGCFDNNGDDDTYEWPRGTTEATKALAHDFGQLGHMLRKELKPKAA